MIKTALFVTEQNLPLNLSEFTTIATEWKLACGDRYKSEFSQSIFVSGYMFGVLIFSILSDKYGRRKPWLFAYIVGGILGLMTGLVRTYEEYIALRFIVGAIKGGGGLITYVLSTESIGPSYRGKLLNRFVGQTLLALFHRNI